jgi:molybdenum cofactor synthesis domain-containing protein
MIRVGILTVSDKGARGEREDTSSLVIREVLSAVDASVDEYEVVPDELRDIAGKLRSWADEVQLDLILTTGGTGVAARDVTPEATLVILDRVVPGLVEVMRSESLKKTPMAMLSRAVAGIRKNTLIVNLPGSPKAARECLEAVLPALPHAIELLRGEVGEHLAPERESE